jgi:hypothetical protein
VMWLVAASECRNSTRVLRRKYARIPNGQNSWVIDQRDRDERWVASCTASEEMDPWDARCSSDS